MNHQHDSIARAVARRLPRAIGSALLTSAVLAAPPAVAASISSTVGTQDFIDAPTWEVVDFVTFAFDDDAIFAVLSPLAHEPDSELGVAPGEPHGPPFDTELSDGLAAIGLTSRDLFHGEEFAGAPTLIWFGFMLHPNIRFAPEGRTPDGELPMLANELFPFVVEYHVQFNGADVESGVLSRTALPDEFDVDGDSHIPLFISFDPLTTDGAAGVGDYSVRYHLRDSFGNGYDVESAFSIVDAPNTMWLAGLLAPCLLARARRRA